MQPPATTPQKSMHASPAGKVAVSVTHWSIWDRNAASRSDRWSPYGAEPNSFVAIGVPVAQ